MTVASDNAFPSVLLVEGDPEDLAANPAAGQRRLAVGADHLLYLVDDAGAATLVGGVADILDLATAETDDALVLAPDGAGGVEFRAETGGGSLTDHTHAVTGSGSTGGGASLAPTSLRLPTATGALATTEGLIGYDSDDDIVKVYDGQRERAVTNTGWTPFALPLNYSNSAALTSTLTIAANGGSYAVPMLVPSHMLLEAVVLRQVATATARTWGWDLYAQALNAGNSGENTLARVAASTADDSFTPGAASTRTLAAGSAPIYLAPGVYWLVIQSRHATSTFLLGATAVGAVAATLFNGAQLKTTSNPNGATLDFVAATWTKDTAVPGIAMQGRVFGQTTAWGP